MADELTVDAILERLATLPDRETWVLSFLFPPNQALVYPAPGERIVAINPDTWRAWLPRIEAEQAAAGTSPWLWLRPLLLDHVEGEAPDLARIRRDERMRVFGLVAAVVQTSAELARAFDTARQ